MFMSPQQPGNST